MNNPALPKMKIAKDLLSTLVLISAFSVSAQADVQTMLFREKDGNTQHLYQAVCLDGPTAVCSLKIMSVSNDKSPRACSVSYQKLFENEKASSPNKGTFTVSVGGGACGYTNTYVISSQGLIQTKTSPPKIPDGLKGLCQTFAPKTYKAEVFADDKTGFMNVPMGNCKAINVMME